MTTLVTAVQKHLAYRRTVAELHAMRRETAWDLNMFVEDAEKIAAKAVYGK